MAIILPSAELASEKVETPSLFRRAEDKQRRLNFEFFDQIDCLDLSDIPPCIFESLDGAD
jgi:hypothetical protein